METGDKARPTQEHVYDEPVRSDMHCHNCTKKFIGRLDYRIDGLHEIVCPVCGHIHYRVIKAGKITGDRWPYDKRTGKPDQVEVVPVSTWRHDSLKAETVTTCRFLRELWYNPNAEGEL